MPYDKKGSTDEVCNAKSISFFLITTKHGLKECTYRFFSLLAKLFFILRHQYLKLLLFKGQKMDFIHHTPFDVWRCVWEIPSAPNSYLDFSNMPLFFFLWRIFLFLQPGKKVDLEWVAAMCLKLNTNLWGCRYRKNIIFIKRNPIFAIKTEALKVKVQMIL